MKVRLRKLLATAALAVAIVAIGSVFASSAQAQHFGWRGRPFYPPPLPPPPMFRPPMVHPTPFGACVHGPLGRLPHFPGVPFGVRPW